MADHTLPQSSNLSRRALIASAAAIPAAAALPASAAVVALPAADTVLGAGTHPDAELLAAWDDYLRQALLIDELGSSISEEQHEEMWTVRDALMDRFEQMPAKTPDGIRVKLLRLLEYNSERLDIARAVWSGQNLDDLVEDHAENMIWQLIADVQRLAGNATSA